MIAVEPTFIALVIGSAAYFLLAAVALKRGNMRERETRVLVLYAAISGLWGLEQLAWRLGWLDALGINVYILARIVFYGLILLALLFLHLTRAFLRLPKAHEGWALLGVAWIAVLVVLDGDFLGLPQILWMARQWGLSRPMLTFGLAVAGWGLLMAVSAWLILKTYRQTELPLHRNRLKYWQMAWAVTLTGDILFLAGQEVVGGGVRLLGALIAAYVVLTHRLPDVRQTTRRVLSYLVMALLGVALYTVGVTAIQYIFQNMPGYDPLWAGAAVALLLAALFAPLLKLVQRLANRLIARTSYDPGQLVSEYSLRISNIVSLERLATVMVGLLSQTMQIRRGALFIVNFTKGQAGTKAYELEGIRGVGEDLPAWGVLSADSLLTRHWRDGRRPLTQYDVDLLPAFRYLAAAERAWLSGLGMDVYVPIHAQESWIGLLALGPKLSGDRYFDEDLALLSTLADQTAVALENARLVDDLVKLNADLQDAYMALARANKQLQEMDRLKSAFIGVITHELRSPFANIAFSLQLFSRYGLDNLTPEQREQLEQLTTSLKQAKAMVDNLITFATFLGKQGELTLAELNFHDLLRDTLLPLRSVAETKGLKLYADVPDRLPPLWGDRDRLADAVYHLVHNAIKFTPSGGEVWIRCQLMDSALLFEVKDTGVGVPADKLPTLWEGFAQMADPLRRGVEGLGLGLALVKYIVTAHNGRVWAESQEGTGSTFGFQVPLGGPDAPSLVPDYNSAVG